MPCERNDGCCCSTPSDWTRLAAQTEVVAGREHLNYVEEGVDLTFIMSGAVDSALPKDGLNTLNGLWC